MHWWNADRCEPAAHCIVFDEKRLQFCRSFFFHRFVFILSPIIKEFFVVVAVSIGWQNYVTSSVRCDSRKKRATKMKESKSNDVKRDIYSMTTFEISDHRDTHTQSTDGTTTSTKNLRWIVCQSGCFAFTPCVWMCVRAVDFCVCVWMRRFRLLRLSMDCIQFQLI